MVGEGQRLVSTIASSHCFSYVSAEAEPEKPKAVEARLSRLGIHSIFPYPRLNTADEGTRRRGLHTEDANSAIVVTDPRRPTSSFTMLAGDMRDMPSDQCD